MLIRIALVVLCVVGTFSHACGEGLDADEFARLHKLLTPAEDEPWRTIPWKISVLDAQRAAVQEGKPIFIWAMDGHPLGCT